MMSCIFARAEHMNKRNTINLSSMVSWLVDTAAAIFTPEINLWAPDISTSDSNNNGYSQTLLSLNLQ
jgi:hypothetical protein